VQPPAAVPYSPSFEPTELDRSMVDLTMVRVPAPTVPPTKAFAQTIAGRYELRDKIAQGTFGVVYTARDLHLDRDVAVKLLHAAHAENKEIVQRFLQEARAAARIDHPGIVTMFDCGTSDGDAFIVMELMHGETLTARMDRTGKLAPAVAVEIVRQIASALDAAHEAHVLHRDLKPDNIYLVPDPAMPGGERVKVLDFGLAKLGNGGQTELGTVFGTPRYMSPEQCRSATNIDQRSDIYALGCILFELVSDRTPFEGSLREIVLGHQRAPIPRASSFSVEVSPVLDDLILQMLQKDAALRPQTMAAVQRMLKTVETAPVLAFGSGPRALPPPAPTKIEQVPQTRGRAMVVAAALAFVIAGALTAIAARGPARAKAASPPASAQTTR
jgi:eukaryotic-like serine/threonine-protein kinase